MVFINSEREREGERERERERERENLLNTLKKQSVSSLMTYKSRAKTSGKGVLPNRDYWYILFFENHYSLLLLRLAKKNNGKKRRGSVVKW
jgi:hypothetical protein